MWSFELKRIDAGILSLIYVLLLEIQLSRGEGWDLINQSNPATFLCLSQARTWISYVIYDGLFFVFNELR
jgi:hypothetical protein